jgi:hypothetical protein
MAIVLGSPPLGAASIAGDIPYSTTAWFSAYGFPSTGNMAVGFQGVSGTLKDFSSIPLGQFTIAPPPGVTTTFKDMPFGIDFHAPQFDSTKWVTVTPPPPGVPYQTLQVTSGTFTVLGHLDGTISAGGGSNLVATIDHVRLGDFPNIPIIPESIYLNGLPFSKADLHLPQQLDLSTGPHSSRTVDLTAEVVPEPSSALVFLLAGASLGAWRLRRNGLAGRGV